MDESKRKKHKDDKSERADKSHKIHIEIAVGNWKRLGAYIDAYNEAPDRMTPKYKLADVINAALASYLARRVK